MKRLEGLWHPAKPCPEAVDSEDAAMAALPDEAPAPPRPEPAADAAVDAPEAAAQRAGLLMDRLDRWLRSMESLRLAEYVRYVSDRRRLIRSSFYGGVARGLGMAVGFTILGAVLVLILQDLAKHNLPLIGDMLAKIVSIVQNRLE